jgi:hypothetical protein
VIDRTAPPHPLARQVVSLEIVERAARSERRTLSDAHGNFAFIGLPLGGIRVFILATEYQGVRYESDRVTLALDSPARSQDLVVYDGARGRAGLRATVAFAVVDIGRGGIRVSVIQRFENPTDRTLVPTGDDPLVFPLPRGAEAVAFLAGWRAPRLTEGQITDTIPLRPGTQQVAYAFDVEARTQDVTFPWKLPYGAADVEILVQDVGVRPRAESLHPAGTVAGPRGRYLRWSGGPVAPGSEVAISLEGVPVAQHILLAVVIAALAVALGSGLVWALRRPGTARG